MPAKIGNVASFSIGMNMVFKVTCDAARLMNAPKAFKVCTTCIIQFLGNVKERGKNTFVGLVKYIATKPQSCVNALTVRVWFGKDDKANVRAARATASHSAYRVLTVGLYTQVTAHVVPIMEEAAQLEGKRGGLELDGVMERSPFTYERAGMHKDEQGVDLPRAKGNLHMRPLEKLPGTKANMHKGHARECLVTKVRIMPLFLFCFDGATTMAATGVSLRSRTPDPFTTVNKDDMGCFNDVRVLRRGQSITDVAEELSPGCTSRTHPDHWLISYIVDLNRHSVNSELHAITREPAREPEPQMAEGLGKRASRIFGNPTAHSDGRTDVRMPYKDAAVQKILSAKGWDAFVPGINGDLDNAAQRKCANDTLIRVPAVISTRRELSDAAWAKRASFADGTFSLIDKFGLCIIHCAMRTMESTLMIMLKFMMDRYVANKKNDKKMIDTHLNKRLMQDLRLRRLIQVDQKGALIRVSLNGEEVRSLIEDLLSGNSKLLAAVRNTYLQLHDQPEDAVTHVNRWEHVLTHWAKAMGAAYVLHATEADRQVFRENVKQYVIKKAMIRAGCCCWYDWQLYSVMTKLFDKFESLMLISQEGMEACQKRNNMLMRLGNNFANAGRIPWRVLQGGAEVVRAYMKTRKENMLKPEKWLWLRNIFSFFSANSELMTRVETYKKEKKSIDWEAQFSPEWVSCIVVTIIYCRLRARRLFNKSYRERRLPGNGEILSWQRTEPAKARWMQLPRAFTVRVYDGHRKAIVNELMNYYAPCTCEQSATFSEMNPETQRKAIQRERRQRWNARPAVAGLWVATEERVGIL